jgi:anti-sigma regulatory factor (Ser/Thr protein kinase)
VNVEAEGTFRGRLATFGEVRALAEAFGAAMGADRGAVLRLVLVLEELFTNTVTHGYPAGGEGPIWIAFAQRADLIEVTYEDAGPPFDPLGEAAARLEDPRARSQDPRVRPEDPCVGPDDPRARPQDPRARSQDPRVSPDDAAAIPDDPRWRPEDFRTPPEDPRVRPQDPRVGEGEPLGGIGLAIVRGLSTSARYARVGDRNRITLTVLAASAPSPDAGA